ncbi:Alpha/Beta hydrolase protein [Amylostereum chailletii]|nr:Alpha/Beta hydrolase protein [Amylostereum chailletii]
MWAKTPFKTTYLACALIFQDVSASAIPIVDLGYVRYRGNLTFPDSVAYLGIPYAEPPVGDGRFRAPAPLNISRVRSEAGGQVVNLTSYPDFCIQGTTGSGDAGGAGSEDCLKIDVYAPLGAGKNDNLPVLVYIHGGGYTYGNPANWPFNHWIHQSQPVVVVSVRYRLDSFGFLATPEFSDSRNGDFNVGFRDQIQALKWVKAHISSFGGDPNKVTINGESAGGSSVELHLVAHEKETLFARAIAQSVYRTPLPTPEEQKPLFDVYTEAAGCPSGSAKDQLACLRKASVSALARAQDKVTSFAPATTYNAFHPVLDGQLLTDYPTRSIVRGEFRQVPLMVGATSDEVLTDTTVLGAALQAMFPAVTNTTVARFEAVYPVTAYANESDRNRVALGESQLICARSIMGNAWRKSNPTFTYRYNQANPTGSDLVHVGHAAENWMMFLGTNTGFNGSTTFSPMTPTETAFAEELIAYWLSFVRSGNPNTFKLDRSPEWRAFTSGDKARIVLQQGPNKTTTESGSFLEVEDGGQTKRCAFVASVVGEEQN